MTSIRSVNPSTWKGGGKRFGIGKAQKTAALEGLEAFLAGVR